MKGVKLLSLQYGGEINGCVRVFVRHAIIIFYCL